VDFDDNNRAAFMTKCSCFLSSNVGYLLNNLLSAETFASCPTCELHIVCFQFLTKKTLVLISIIFFC